MKLLPVIIATVAIISIAGIFTAILILKRQLRRLSFMKMIMDDLVRNMDFSEAAAGLKKIGRSGDEIGAVSRSITGLINVLSEILHKLQSIADTSASASEELAVSSSGLANNVLDEQQMVINVEYSMKAINEAIASIARDAGVQSENSTRIGALTQELNASIHEIEDMVNNFRTSAVEAKDNARAVNKTIEDTKETMAKMLESSGKISEIVTLINDISDQTNLLSLNAAIEAARAGEHGRGFAVVADEISKLAEQTANSTREIESLISSVSADVDNGVSMVSNVAAALHAIIDGVSLISDRIGNLTAIVSEQTKNTGEVDRQAQNLASLVNSINESSQVQSRNIEDTYRFIGSIREITEQVTTGAKEVYYAADEISRQANDVEGMMSQFNFKLQDSMTCPNLDKCPIFQNYKFVGEKYHFIDEYCRGSFNDCARKKVKDSGRPVPADLMPDGEV